MLRTHPQGCSSDWGDDKSPVLEIRSPPAMGWMLWDKGTGRAMGGPSLAAGHSNCTVTLSRDCPQKNACSDSREPEVWSPFRPAAGVVRLRGQARQDEDTHHFPPRVCFPGHSCFIWCEVLSPEDPLLLNSVAMWVSAGRESHGKDGLSQARRGDQNLGCVCPHRCGCTSLVALSALKPLEVSAEPPLPQPCLPSTSTRCLSDAATRLDCCDTS